MQRLDVAEVAKLGKDNEQAPSSQSSKQEDIQQEGLKQEDIKQEDVKQEDVKQEDVKQEQDATKAGKSATAGSHTHCLSCVLYSECSMLQHASWAAWSSSLMLLASNWNR